MKNEIKKIDPKEFGLQEKQVLEIEKSFMPKIKERNGYISMYNDLLKKELTTETCNEAGELRRKLVKVRTGIAAIHRTQKSYYLAAGRFVDAWKNKETEPVLQMEDKLSEIETYFELQEQKRLEILQNIRVTKLSKFVDDAHDRDLSKFAEDEFEALLAMKQKQHEDLIAAEKKAEAERIAKIKAEAAENERIRKENERLQEAAAAAERKIKAEREQRDELERIKDELERIKAEEIEKQRQAAERKKAAEYEAKLNKERAKRAELERKEISRINAEAAAAAEAERKRQSELNKGDEDKVKDLISDITGLKSKYTFKSKNNQKMYNDFGYLVDKIINRIKK